MQPRHPTAEAREVARQQAVGLVADTSQGSDEHLFDRQMGGGFGLAEDPGDAGGIVGATSDAREERASLHDVAVLVEAELARIAAEQDADPVLPAEAARVDLNGRQHRVAGPNRLVGPRRATQVGQVEHREGSAERARHPGMPGLVQADAQGEIVADRA